MRKLVSLLRHRLKLLEVEKRLYEQNPILSSTLKMANIELVQNDIATLKDILRLSNFVI
ncbi:MAG: hypothetical protein HY761_05200 [Candidatus Omnitrophica bacterium]|nr:hypothetical protein [Candidatus Omnitrophota bacterium]